jgi:hypothetical protein
MPYLRDELKKSEDLAAAPTLGNLHPDARMQAVARSKPEPSYAPVYAAAVYPEWAKIARQHGYALAVHGSLQRDFDLIAVPWVDEVSSPEVLVEALIHKRSARVIGGPPSDKPHGRMAYTLSIGYGECAVDLSFMPRGQHANVDSMADQLAAALRDVLAAVRGSKRMPDTVMKAEAALDAVRAASKKANAALAAYDATRGVLEGGNVSR